MRADILIVGGGTGGCAAALAASALGLKVVLSEETAWLGGQLTAQAVPPDENRWIETFGATLSYRRLREAVRDYYRRHYPLAAGSRMDPYLNPGDGRVSRLCVEPRVWLAALEAALAYARASDRVRVLARHMPVAAAVAGDSVRAVTLRSLHGGNEVTVEAKYVLDATELGDLLPLAGVEYRTGSESRAETGEPHANDGPARPDNVQAISWCFALGFDPAEDADHTISQPPRYAHWRDYEFPIRPPWPGKVFGWIDPDVRTLQPKRNVLFPWEDSATNCLWNFRRIMAACHYAEPHRPEEVSLVNWPQIDYIGGNLIDTDPERKARYLEESRQQSLGYLYWLQTEAPRPDGGCGYPGLRLRPDMVGTEDGLAMHPYIRESRRIRAVFTVTENHVGVEARGGHHKRVKAEPFRDSVGIGHYNIDLHPSTGGDNYIDIATAPFQIPLGALVPVRMKNLLPAAKNIGTTHVTNGCYRLHPIEWNIGESAGLLAAFCILRDCLPRQVLADAGKLADFQELLRRRGIPLEWPDIGDGLP